MVRTMTINDYENVEKLWKKIKGFVIRSIDDSKDGIERFLKRNPTTCVVAEEEGRIVGSILCGHDGRKGCMYHVCVDPDFRRKGIGKSMVLYAIDKLQEEKINDVSIIAFTANDIGNAFWKKLGWELRCDINSYEVELNKENVRTVNK